MDSTAATCSMDSTQLQNACQRETHQKCAPKHCYVGSCRGPAMSAVRPVRRASRGAQPAACAARRPRPRAPPGGALLLGHCPAQPEQHRGVWCAEQRCFPATQRLLRRPGSAQRAGAHHRAARTRCHRRISQRLFQRQRHGSSATRRRRGASQRRPTPPPAQQAPPRTQRRLQCLIAWRTRRSDAGLRQRGCRCGRVGNDVSACTASTRAPF